MQQAARRGTATCYHFTFNSPARAQDELFKICATLEGNFLLRWAALEHIVETSTVGSRSCSNPRWCKTAAWLHKNVVYCAYKLQIFSSRNSNWAAARCATVWVKHNIIYTAAQTLPPHPSTCTQKHTHTHSHTLFHQAQPQYRMTQSEFTSCLFRTTSTVSHAQVWTVSILLQRWDLNSTNLFHVLVIFVFILDIISIYYKRRAMHGANVDRVVVLGKWSW